MTDPGLTHHEDDDCPGGHPMSTPAPTCTCGHRDGSHKAAADRTDYGRDKIGHCSSCCDPESDGDNGCDHNYAPAGVPAAPDEQHIASLLDQLEQERAGASERARLLLDAKDHWRDRAVAAEAELEQERREYAQSQDGPTTDEWVAMNREATNRAEAAEAALRHARRIAERTIDYFEMTPTDYYAKWAEGQPQMALIDRWRALLSEAAGSEGGE